MGELVKAEVIKGIVTGNAENGIDVIDATVGQFVWVREQSLLSMADRLKRVETSHALSAEAKAKAEAEAKKAASKQK